MIKIFVSLLYVSLILTPFTGNSQGIRFNSSESSIVERTSYNLFEHNQQKFTGNFSIEFDLSIVDDLVCVLLLDYASTCSTKSDS